MARRKTGSGEFPFVPKAIKPGITGEARYRPVPKLHGRGAASISRLADYIVDRGSIFRKVVIEAVLAEATSYIPDFIRENKESVRLGDMATIKPCITGSLKYANGEADPVKNKLELRITPLPAFRHALRDITPINMIEEPSTLSGIYTEKTDESGQIVPSSCLQSGVEVTIKGHNIYVKPGESGEDGGHGKVWLETVKGEYVADFTVHRSGDDVIWASLDASVQLVGKEYIIVVESYGTEKSQYPKNRRLCIARLKVPV